MRESVRAAVQKGVPCIAECGGFMYLLDAVGDHPMAGALPGRSFDAGKLTRFGYLTLTAQRDNLLCRAGESIAAHEFHRWDADDPGEAFMAEKPAAGPASTRPGRSMRATRISTFTRTPPSPRIF